MSPVLCISWIPGANLERCHLARSRSGGQSWGSPAGQGRARGLKPRWQGARAPCLSARGVCLLCPCGLGARRAEGTARLCSTVSEVVVRTAGGWGQLGVSAFARLAAETSCWRGPQLVCPAHPPLVALCVLGVLPRGGLGGVRLLPTQLRAPQLVSEERQEAEGFSEGAKPVPETRAASGGQGGHTSPLVGRVSKNL